MKIGKAKYGITQKKYFKLKDGENTFRILPPLGELADDGKWSVFYKVHYGYKNTQGKLRVFQSSLVVNRSNKMVETPDAADQRIKDLKAKLEEAKNAGNKAVVEKLGKLVSGQKPMYNLDSNHYMNAIDSQGNIGVLKLRHRAKTALDEKIKQLREKGIDPLSVDNGRYFVIRRAGTGLDTSFSVEVAQEKLTVQGVGEVNRDIVHKLNDELIGRLGQEAAELGKLFKKLSSDDIERVVKSSDLLTGQSPVIDELFDNKGDTSGSDEEDDDSSESSGAAGSGSGTQAAAAPTQAAQTTAPVAAPVQQTVAQPTPAPQAAPQVTVTSTPQTTSEVVAEMSDADFLKTLNLQ